MNNFDDGSVHFLVGLVLGLVISGVFFIWLCWSDGKNYNRVRDGLIVQEGHTFVSYSAVRRISK